MNNQEFNSLLERCRNFIDRIVSSYQYPDNITHLLYLILPAFILKYQDERYILRAFSEIPVFIQDTQDKVFQASYTSVPYLENSIYQTHKFIVLNHYENISLMQLLDNLVHEFNHAIHSIHNEILERDEKIYIRTGLTYFVYLKQDLVPNGRVDNYTLIEEIINTKQTEMIIDIINSFNQYSIHDREIQNTLYSIQKSIQENTYRSSSYFLQSLLCRELMENKTFISTLETLRFQGDVEEIDGWFDQITGKENSFKRLAEILSITLDLQVELEKKKFFKSFTINKIKKLNQEALEIVRLFDMNCNYR